MTRIAIIGGGLSGSLAAVNLLRIGRCDDEITLIETRARVGFGQAYSTTDPQHLLNVLPESMSPFPHQRRAFLEFLAANPGLIPPGSEPLGQRYLPRRVYARFIEATIEAELNRPAPGPKLHLLQGYAVKLSVEGAEHARSNVIQLADGRIVSADKVVLAMGNLPPRRPAAGDPGFYASDRYIGNPWKPGALSGIPSGETVLLLGTGLTMVDCVQSLQRNRHAGAIVAVSRHGFVPRAHGGSAAWPIALDPEVTQSVTRLLRFVRHQVGIAKAQGIEWQAVINGLRSHIQTLWRGFPEAEQRRFLRHVRAWWDVHRHRIPRSAAATVEQLQIEGQLKVIAGHLRDLVPRARDAEVTVAPRGGGTRIRLAIGRLINCSGPNYDFTTADQPVLTSLIDEGRLTLDRHRLGIAVDDRYAALSRAGHAAQDLFAMGPMLRGHFWEINAAAEISVQAEQLARTLLSGRRAPASSADASLCSEN